MVASAVMLSLGACDSKKEAAAPASTPASAPPPAVASQPAAVAPPAAVTPAATPAAKTAALTADERAAKLGFVKYLPPDTEVVMAFHNGLKTANHFTSSKLGKLVQGYFGMPALPAPDADAAPDGAKSDTAKDAKPVVAQGQDPTDAANSFKSQMEAEVQGVRQVMAEQSAQLQQLSGEASAPFVEAERSIHGALDLEAAAAPAAVVSALVVENSAAEPPARDENQLDLFDDPPPAAAQPATESRPHA